MKSSNSPMQTRTPPKSHYASSADGYPPKIDFPETQLKSLMAGATEALVKFVDEIDVSIVNVDKVLKYAQPPEFGALRVAWRKRKDTTLRTPQIIEWRRDKHSGLWSYSEVKQAQLTKRAKFSGNFLEHHERVVDCLAKLNYLLPLRKRAIEMMRLYRLHSKNLIAQNEDQLLGLTIQLAMHNVALKPVREARDKWLVENPESVRKKNRKGRGRNTGSEPEYTETVTLIEGNDDEDDLDDENA